eukprot:CAMPEP_0116971572 /NCGR_PEP_ID=MMETSP0467-20121206/53276_1 /TAXON_ID=283647 /ORGANISM="Mesodinium pulex, Strain SPMC105" /LENGTH=143 /DNA_ID=CAMNT_0004662797 /DNA_START=395 /DNA_END=826 /DNA_ORIENTATION=-
MDSEGLENLSKNIEKEYSDQDLLNIQGSIDTLSKMDGPIFFVANEVFDALPTYSFVWNGTEWMENVIVLNDHAERVKGNYFKYDTRKTNICKLLMKDKHKIEIDPNDPTAKSDEVEIADATNTIDSADSSTNSINNEENVKPK